MKKFVKIALVILGVWAYMEMFSYIQQDHYVLECVAKDENGIAFDINDNEYWWDCDVTKYEVGKEYKVGIFTYENCDPTDDEIMYVKGMQ